MFYFFTKNMLDLIEIFFNIFPMCLDEKLLSFNFDLLRVDRYYTDGHFTYSNIYEKKASQEKSRYTNININRSVTFIFIFSFF